MVYRQRSLPWSYGSWTMRHILVLLLTLFVASPVFGQAAWTAAFEAAPADNAPAWGALRGLGSLRLQLERT